MVEPRLEPGADNPSGWWRQYFAATPAPPVATVDDVPFARNLVIDRLHHDTSDFPPGNYFRTAGLGGICAIAVEWQGARPFSSVWGLSPDQLRFLLTYFDRIDVPCIPDLDPDPSDDEDYLLSVGFITRTIYPLIHDDGYLWPVDEFLPDFSYAPGNALLDHQAAEKGSWSLYPRGPGDDFGPSASDLSTLEVQLYSALPAPAVGVPFEYVLDFRARHLDELTDLRLGMYDLSQQIANSTDVELAVKVAQTKIARASESIIKALQKQDRPFSLFSLNTSFSVYDGLKFTGTSSALATAGWGLLHELVTVVKPLG